MNKSIEKIESEFIYGDSTGLKIEVEMRKYDDGSIFRTLIIYEDEAGTITQLSRRIK